MNQNDHIKVMLAMIVISILTCTVFLLFVFKEFANAQQITIGAEVQPVVRCVSNTDGTNWNCERNF